MAVKRYRYAFAQNATPTADRVPIPDTSVSNSVNYSTGYTQRYALQYGVNPQALPVERQYFNQLMYDITTSLKDWQDYGFPQWQDPLTTGAGLYFKGAVVRYAIDQVNPDVPPFNLFRCVKADGTAVPPNNDRVNWEMILITSQLLSEVGLINFYPNSDVPASSGGTVYDFNSPPEPLSGFTNGIYQFRSDATAQSWLNAPPSPASAVAGVLEHYEYPSTDAPGFTAGSQRYTTRDGHIWCRSYNPLGSSPYWTTWIDISVASGAKGGGSEKIVYLNDQTVTVSYDMPSNQNGVTAGPITINAGATWTVPSGATWTVV